MLVGNKVDLEESSEREVSTETGETFAKVSYTFHCTHTHTCNNSIDLRYYQLCLHQQIYGAEFIETSAKTGYNVGTALLMLVRYIRIIYTLNAQIKSNKYYAYSLSPTILTSRSIKSYYESRGSNAINSEYKKTVQLKEQEAGSKCCSR